MFSYVMVGSSDLKKSKAFYDATLGVLGYDAGVVAQDDHECVYVSENGSFVLCNSVDGIPASHADGVSIGLKVPDSSAVDAWHAAGVANGGTSYDNPPGIRDNGEHRVYCAYLRDPDGNNLCAIVWLKVYPR